MNTLISELFQMDQNFLIDYINLLHKGVHVQFSFKDKSYFLNLNKSL